MTPDLSSYREIGTTLVCRVDVPDYAILRFSAYNANLTVNDETYTGLGSLLGVSDSSSVIRAVPGELTISISGIPSGSIADILNSKIKGSKIQVWRVLFNPTTGTPLSITGNPTGRFQGIVTNYNIEETYDTMAQSATNTITLLCASNVEILSNKISGRRTNQYDQRAIDGGDASMDRVNKLSNANLNWGAP